MTSIVLNILVRFCNCWPSWVGLYWLQWKAYQYRHYCCCRTAGWLQYKKREFLKRGRKTFVSYYCCKSILDRLLTVKLVPGWLGNSHIRIMVLQPQLKNPQFEWSISVRLPLHYETLHFAVISILYFYPYCYNKHVGRSIRRPISNLISRQSPQ
jgi:hypothetical protein